MFILMPVADPRVAATCFSEADLKQNYGAAMNTIYWFFGEIADTDDPIARYNQWAWGHNIMRLVEYAEIMANQYVANGWSDVAVETDLSQYVTQAASLEDQSMLWPTWVGNERIHEAHRGYLISRDEMYRALWPSTVLHVLPVPGTDSEHAFG